jgi:hypothetical protein
MTLVGKSIHLCSDQSWAWHARCQWPEHVLCSMYVLKYTLDPGPRTLNLRRSHNECVTHVVYMWTTLCNEQYFPQPSLLVHGLDFSICFCCSKHCEIQNDQMKIPKSTKLDSSG